MVVVMMLVAIGKGERSDEYLISRAIGARALMAIGEYRANLELDEDGRRLLRCIMSGRYRIREYPSVVRSHHIGAVESWRLTSVRVNRTHRKNIHPTIRVRFLDEFRNDITVSVLGTGSCWEEEHERGEAAHQMCQAPLEQEMPGEEAE